MWEVGDAMTGPIEQQVTHAQFQPWNGVILLVREVVVVDHSHTSDDKSNDDMVMMNDDVTPM